MLVPDASLVVDLLIDGGDRGAWAADQVSFAGSLHAPHLVDLEVVAALRNRVTRDELSVRRAAKALDDFGSLHIRRYPAAPLLERIWQLRGRLTPYDAAYVSLAEALDVPLVTTDQRLARAGGHQAHVLAFTGRP
ncbi:MAG TPA: type II toxin-antitoxin system VapC family toxin [Gaiellaceae bacterium]|jgi:predicted nucleic acid-binding protein|nr:type II toxin-antitoxin system VapC family toxin [Gaiellaceae bacterium]